MATSIVFFIVMPLVLLAVVVLVDTGAMGARRTPHTPRAAPRASGIGWDDDDHGPYYAEDPLQGVRKCGGGAEYAVGYAESTLFKAD